MTNYKIFFLCFLFFLSLISCSVIEKTVSMRDFNYIKNSDKYKLVNPVFAKLIFNPKIDIQITSESVFLKKIDSNFVKNLKENFKEKLKNCNIDSSDNQNNEFVIEINGILLKENLVSRGYFERKSNTYNSTTENKILILLKGTIQKNLSQKENIVFKVIHETTSDKDLLFNIFDVKRDNSLTSGVIEENSIQNFAIKCAEIILKNRKL